MLSCEGKITAEECAKVLQSFQLNKAPGNDGIPVEFYIKFWPIISELFINCANECFRQKRRNVVLAESSCNHLLKREKIVHF